MRGLLRSLLSSLSAITTPYFDYLSVGRTRHRPRYRYPSNGEPPICGDARGRRYPLEIDRFACLVYRVRLIRFTAAHTLVHTYGGQKSSPHFIGKLRPASSRIDVHGIAGGHLNNLQ